MTADLVRLFCAHSGSEQLVHDRHHRAVYEFADGDVFERGRGLEENSVFPVDPSGHHYGAFTIPHVSTSL